MFPGPCPPLSRSGRPRFPFKAAPHHSPQADRQGPVSCTPPPDVLQNTLTPPRTVGGDPDARGRGADQTGNCRQAPPHSPRPGHQPALLDGGRLPNPGLLRVPETLREPGLIPPPRPLALFLFYFSLHLKNGA